MALRVDVEDNGDERLLRVDGDVDMDSSPNLRDHLLKALKACRTVRVELANVRYLDSSGVAVLIQGYKAAQEGRKFILVNPSSQVDAVIALAQLGRLFTIEREAKP